MGMRKFKPVTPGQRGKAISDFSEITKHSPERTLLEKIHRSYGRDSMGHVSAQRRGGGHKKKFRIIDWKRDKRDVPAIVVGIEYDPNRTANIALLNYPDGVKAYILAPLGLKPGDLVTAGDNVKTALGNALPLSKINIGSFVHNVELHPGRGAQIVRSAGSYAKLLGRDGDWVSLELPSGEVRLVLGTCYATVGELGNKDHQNENSGKAGRTRWQGVRPRVRAVVRNPVDHPMGGGEGRSSGGRHPCSPKGLIAKGMKTRRQKKHSTQFILRKRSK